MRKKTFMMSMLLTLGLFSACSSDDELNGVGNGETILIPEDGVLLTPVENKDIEGYEAISKFFSTEMPIGARSKGFFVDSDQDECSVIDSIQGLTSIYKGNQEIPNIDFEHYTLVLGQIFSPDAYYPVLRQNLEFRDNKCQQNIYVPNLKGKYTMNSPLYYWALYPKFRTDGISTSIVKESGLKSVNLPGYLRYNNIIDRWYVAYSVEGMYESDEYYIMNPMDLPDECIANKENYQDNWTSVSFSGEFFEMNDEAFAGLFAGKDIWPTSGQNNLIYISNIEKAE